MGYLVAKKSLTRQKKCKTKCKMAPIDCRSGPDFVLHYRATKGATRFFNLDLTFTLNFRLPISGGLFDTLLNNHSTQCH